MEQPSFVDKRTQVLGKSVNDKPTGDKGGFGTTLISPPLPIKIMKSKVRIIKRLEPTAGGLHSWVKAVVVKPKKNGRPIGETLIIRKPNSSL